MWHSRFVLMLACLAVAVSAQTEPSFKDIGDDPLKLDIIRVTQQNVMQGYPDGTFRPKSPLTEGEFAVIVDRLLALCPNMTKPDFQVIDQKQPITRLRAVTVIIRSAEGKAAVEAITDAQKSLSACADASKIPEWGVKYAAYAVDRGYMRVDGSFRPNDSITRSELAGILARCIPPASVAPANPEGYTSLVVDCRGMNVHRSYSPSVVAEDGCQIYPDVKNLPSIEFIEEHGLVSYVSDAALSKRSGERPLQVAAVGVKGTAKQTAVVSNADKDTIIAEDGKSHFLAHWNVVFLTGPKPQSEPEAQQEESSTGDKSTDSR